MKAPAWLHDVLGEEPSAAELAAIVAFALPTATLALLLAQPPVAAWRLIVAWLVLADIAAGCVANFTRSTSDFYAARPLKRWGFIAAHVHLPVFAWLVGAAAASAWLVAAVWAFTIAAASAVNALAGRDKQVFVAGLLLSMGLALSVALPASGLVRIAGVLFLAKVAFSFAVDHYRRPSTHADLVRTLEAREHDAACSLIARAFAADPLFVAVCGDSAPRRLALASFLIDMTRLTGGWVRARSLAERLVAVALVDRPAFAPTKVAHYALVFARFVPTWCSIGATGAGRLNRYFARTRRELGEGSAYLTLLAVDPEAQGRGFGRELVEDALSLSRSARVTSLGLDTENPRNVALYQRYGFTLERELSVDALRVFVMKRGVAGS